MTGPPRYRELVVANFIAQPCTHVKARPSAAAGDAKAIARSFQSGDEAPRARRRHGWLRCGAGDGRARVRWRDPGVRHATFVDNHLFEVLASGTLAVEEHEAAMLVRRGWVRVG